MKIALFGDFAPTLGIVDASVRYELDPISLAIINLETPPVKHSNAVQKQAHLCMEMK